ncbi:MAG: 30S ribosomal protein S17 [Acidimicrobiales bacterium]|nr:30S ribosomal protein S17 [Acidimicrobiales bacterium]RZV45158.1 MAG: 30S ribosomal protein S17 [Acidimicrobiales bacterium]
MSDVENTEAPATEIEETPAASTTATGLAEPSAAEETAESSDAEGRENPRKVREGIVVSTSMDKTAVIESVDRVRHRRYAKTVQRNNKLFAHDENNDANVGDRVRIQETRPLSKKKRWRLVEIIERAR